MKNYITRAVAFSTAVILSSSVLVACGEHRAEHHMRDVSSADLAKFRNRVADRATSKLSLDSSQQTKLAAMLDAAVVQREALIRVSFKRAELCDLLTAEKFDSSKASSLLTSTNPSIDATALVKSSAEFLESLKADQRAKLQRVRAKCSA